MDGLMRQGSELRRLLAGALLLAPLTLAGCLSDRTDPKRPDPLTGLPKRIPANERTVSSGTNDPGRSGALASSGTRSTDGNSGLSIRDGRAPEADRSTNSTGAWTGNESRSAPAPAGGARLGSSPPGAVTPAGGVNFGTRVRTFEEAQQVLMALKVKWQELKNTGDGQWTFACTIPVNGTATSMRTYEDSDKFGLLAMQKVIDKILREQQGR